MAQNLMIGGVIYNGVESMEMTNSAGKKITYIEKVNAGTGVYVAQIGERQFYTVEDALAAAAPGETVTMIADSAESVNLIIPAAVTLDLQGRVLTVNNVVGMSGSFLTATANAGKLFVPKGNIVLSEHGYIMGVVSGATRYILPIWSPVDGCYLFSLFVVNTVANADYGLQIDENAKTLKFAFKHQATGAINQGLLKDGASDNELRVLLHMEWQTSVGKATYEAAFSDSQIGEVTGSKMYTVSLNYGSMGVDIDTLVIYGAIVTNSGATAFGDMWTKESAK